MSALWQDALHSVVVHSDPNGGFVILGDPQGRGRDVSLDQSPAKRTGKKSWLHLNLYTGNQRDEVKRPVQLGARRYPRRYGPYAYYVWLEDPDRNLFFVVQLPEGDVG